MDFPSRVNIDLSQFLDQAREPSKPGPSGLGFDVASDLDFFSTINFMDFDTDRSAAASAAQPAAGTAASGPEQQFKADQFLLSSSQTGASSALAPSSSHIGHHGSSSGFAFPYQAVTPYSDIAPTGYQSSVVPSPLSHSIDSRFQQQQQQQHTQQPPPTASSSDTRPPQPATDLLSTPLITSGTPSLISPDATDTKSLTLEMQARISAEDDKRRRNTMASARFRRKKKLREQEMEKTAKEMTDRAHILEVRVKQLEMENKWLRSLIVDKYGRVPKRAASSESDSVSTGSSDEAGSKRPAAGPADEDKPGSRSTKRRSTVGSKKAASRKAESSASSSSTLDDSEEAHAAAVAV